MHIYFLPVDSSILWIVIFYDLYFQVRNAIQALQEMSSPSSMGGTSHGPYPAHSNPNIHRQPGSVPILERSSSQPPDMFCWEDSIQSIPPHRITSCTETETQTDDTLEQSIEHFVLQNPTKVLQMLGLTPDLLPIKGSPCGGLRRSRTNPDNHLHAIAVNKVILNNNNHDNHDVSIEINCGRSSFDEEETIKTPWDFTVSTDTRRFLPREASDNGICEAVSNVQPTDS